MQTRSVSISNSDSWNNCASSGSRSASPQCWRSFFFLLTLKTNRIVFWGPNGAVLRCGILPIPGWSLVSNLRQDDHEAGLLVDLLLIVPLIPTFSRRPHTYKTDISSKVFFKYNLKFWKMEDSFKKLFMLMSQNPVKSCRVLCSFVGYRICGARYLRRYFLTFPGFCIKK